MSWLWLVALMAEKEKEDASCNINAYLGIYYGNSLASHNTHITVLVPSWNSTLRFAQQVTW